MENKEKKRMSFLVEDDKQETGSEPPKDGTKGKVEKLKKPIIFILMGIVFIGCIYLIFKPSSTGKKTPDIGLNDAVPQATDAGLQSDKQKAYEQEMMEQKAKEKRDALMSLSDYWNTDSTSPKEVIQVDENAGQNYDHRGNAHRNGNAALNSYRNAQNTLSTFYDNNDYEAKELRRQIEELKEQLAEKDIPKNTAVQDQLALMEKSYEMASKYLPSGASNPVPSVKTDSSVTTSKAKQKENFMPFTPVRKNVVSALYREPSDLELANKGDENRNIAFFTPGSIAVNAKPKNSIRACLQEDQTVIDEGTVKIRLLEHARLGGFTIPVASIVVANAKFNNGRLQLKVTSIEFEGNIIPVDITVYDLDGQQGLYVPYSPEMNALTEIASNMSQTSGTSIMMTRSAGQQAAGDLSRGVVQGISGYFSKKIRTPKVTIKAGYQLFLVSKK